MSSFSVWRERFYSDGSVLEWQFMYGFDRCCELWGFSYISWCCLILSTQCKRPEGCGFFLDLATFCGKRSVYMGEWLVPAFFSKWCFEWWWLLDFCGTERWFCLLHSARIFFWETGGSGETRFRSSLNYRCDKWLVGQVLKVKPWAFFDLKWGLKSAWCFHTYFLAQEGQLPKSLVDTGKAWGSSLSLAGPASTTCRRRLDGKVTRSSYMFKHIKVEYAGSSCSSSLLLFFSASVGREFMRFRFLKVVAVDIWMWDKFSCGVYVL